MFPLFPPHFPPFPPISPLFSRHFSIFPIFPSPCGQSAHSPAAGADACSLIPLLQGRCKGYGLPVDLWSVGVVAYSLLSGFSAFGSGSKKTVMARTLRAKASFKHPVWATITEEAKGFLLGLLVVDPQERLSSAQALGHPWIATAPQV